MTTKEQPEHVPSFQAVARVSPTQQVRDQLLSAIRSGEYAPGMLLPSERKLGEAFGVSRVSIREALAGLAATGLIDIQHGKGASVRSGIGEAYAGHFGLYIEMHRDELAELLRVRGALDGLAAEMAAQGGDSTALTMMDTAHEAFKNAVNDDVSAEELRELDVAFHRSIASASGGKLLPGLLADLNDQLVESRNILFAQPGQPPRSVVGHQEIVDAIHAHDHVVAHRAAVSHVESMWSWVETFQSARAGTQ